MKGVRRAAAALLVAGVAVAGCSSNGTDETPDQEQTTATTDETDADAEGTDDPDQNDDESPTSEPEDEQDGPEDLEGFSTEPQESDGWAGLPAGDTETPEGDAHLVDVRTAQHEGFQRIVFDHSVDGLLQFSAGYTDSPGADGMAESLEVAGEALLELVIRPTTTPEDLDDAPHAAWDPLEGGPVEDIISTPPWEGEALYYIGLDSEREFRVTHLESPSRIVVDILE